MGSRKLEMQVGIAEVNFTDGDQFTPHNGPPDWRDSRFFDTDKVPDAENAAAEACKGE
jgi:hypothetical protein